MILLAMIFMHIVDDYYLQGVLAKMKQSNWWKENAPEKLYKYDYIVALIMHAFSWTFMVMLPIAFNIGFSLDFKFIMLFFTHAIIHAIVDHAKANLRVINLIADQTIHIGQIITIYLLTCVF